MKRIIFLLIGILALSVACQDNFVEPENDLSTFTKSAKVEKIKTFQIKGWVTATPYADVPEIACNPVGTGVNIKGVGWVSGHDNIFGKFDPENSTFQNETCDFMMTEEGPVIYAKTNVILQRMNGDQMFGVNHMWINPSTGEISGFTEITDGTGRFKGVTGSTNMVNGSIDLATGIASWEEDGEITLVLKNKL